MLVAIAAASYVILGASFTTASASQFHQVTFKASYKSDLAKYRAQVTRLASAESQIIAAWTSVSGANYTSDAVMYRKLNSIIPAVNSFITKLEAIKPTDPKIARAHAIYVEGWNYQYQGFTMVMSALDNQDMAQMTQANGYLAKGRAKITEFIRLAKAL